MSFQLQKLVRCRCQIDALGDVDEIMESESQGKMSSVRKEFLTANGNINVECCNYTSDSDALRDASNKSNDPEWSNDVNTGGQEERYPMINYHQCPTETFESSCDYLFCRYSGEIYSPHCFYNSFLPFRRKSTTSSSRHEKNNRGLSAIMKQIIFLLIATFVISPIAAKGPGPPTFSNNVFGGFSRVGADQQLFLQDNHTTTKAQSGATAALHCALSSPLADGLVSWVRRRDYHLLTVGRQVYSSDQRMGVKVSPDGRDWMLTIRWVNPHDAGQYECQVSSHPPQALMVNLSVVDAHAEILGGKERYIHSGSSLRLVCLLRDATEPPVYVFWYRGDRMINYDKERGVSVDNSREASVLYVTSVVSHDEGNYTCMPSNAAPASVTVHVVKRENPAGLQQETNTEKDSKSTASSSSSSKPSGASKKVVEKSKTLHSMGSSPLINWGILTICLLWSI